MIPTCLCAISCFLLALVLICGVVESLGLYHFGPLSEGGRWVMAAILPILLVFGLLRAAFNRLAEWAGRKRDEIDERERRGGKAAGPGGEVSGMGGGVRGQAGRHAPRGA